MTTLLTRIRPLTSPILRIHRSRRAVPGRGEQVALRPGADERLISTSELDQLRRTLPNRVA